MSRSAAVHIAVVHELHEAMGRSAAVHDAVMRELSKEGRPVPKPPKPPKIDDDLTMMGKVMGKDFGYGGDNLITFFQGVARRLKTDIPSFDFKWITLDNERCIHQCLTGDMYVLEAYIANATTLATTA